MDNILNVDEKCAEVKTTTSAPDSVREDVGNHVGTAEHDNKGPASAGLSINPGSRYHALHLSRTSGFLLVRYDADSKIVAFVGGAMRVLENREDREVRPGYTNSTIYSMSPERLFKEGVMKGIQPDVEVEHISEKDGDPRNDPRFVIREIPYYSAYVRAASGISDEEWDKGCYGVITFGPNRSGRFIHKGNLNTENTEKYVLSSTWGPRFDVANVPGSGSGDFGARLSDTAVKVAQAVPTAWPLAVAALNLLGGRNKNVPRTPELRAPAEVMAFVVRELKTRETKKKERVNRRRQVRSVPARDHGAPRVVSQESPQPDPAAEQRVTPAAPHVNPQGSPEVTPTAARRVTPAAPRRKLGKPEPQPDPEVVEKIDAVISATQTPEMQEATPASGPEK